MKYGIYILLSHKKEWNTQYMDELWKHHAKWKKWDAKGHDTIDVKYPE
jgi:hypothetical protein